MNKDTARDYLPLVHALAEGKMIEHEGGAGWYVVKEVSFDSPAERYRIKPEPREVWFNRYPDGSEFGRYTCREEAVEMASIGAVQVCWREVIE